MHPWHTLKLIRTGSKNNIKKELPGAQIIATAVSSYNRMLKTRGVPPRFLTEGILFIYGKKIVSTSRELKKSANHSSPAWKPIFWHCLTSPRNVLLFLSSLLRFKISPPITTSIWLLPIIPPSCLPYFFFFCFPLFSASCAQTSRSCFTPSSTRPTVPSSLKFLSSFPYCRIALLAFKMQLMLPWFRKFLTSLFYQAQGLEKGLVPPAEWLRAWETLRLGEKHTQFIFGPSRPERINTKTALYKY